MTDGDSNDDSDEGLKSQDDVDSQLNGISNQSSPLGPGNENEIEPDQINLVLAEDGNTSRYDLNHRLCPSYLIIIFLISRFQDGYFNLKRFVVERNVLTGSQGTRG